MDAWRDIRIAAREHHLRALSKSGGDRRASALNAAARELDVMLCTA